MAEGRRFKWAYELANFLHVETRPEFIERELLFEVGDCYDPLLLDESARLLRRFRFIALADVFGVPQPDGTRHVVVDTRDEWTTKVNVHMSFDDGFQFEGFNVTEENFLGRGQLIGIFFQERKARRDFGMTLETPQFLGTRWDARFGAGRTRVGNFFVQGLFYPFVGEVGRFAITEQFGRRESLFAYVADPGREFSHVVQPYVEESIEATAAMRIGHPGNLTVFGVGLSREVLDFGGTSRDVEIVTNGDFGNGAPADSATVASIADQTVDRTTTRLNFLIGQRNVHFVRRRGLDALDGVQDVAVGTNVDVTLGRSVGFLRGGDSGRTDDLFARLRFRAGAAPGPSVLAAGFQLEGRRVFEGLDGSDGWHDVLAEADAIAYWQPPGVVGNTLVLRAAASGGWSVITPYQLTLGGRDAVRGYSEESFPGGRRVLLSLEDRISVAWPAPTLFDLGFSIFADAGAVWAGDVPYGGDSGWRGSVGAGIRLGFPSGTAGVVRFDFAYPLSPSHEGSGLVFRVTMSELLGLAAGFEDFQVQRSRRAGVRADFTGVSN